jgi:hypothetical protein
MCFFLGLLPRTIASTTTVVVHVAWIFGQNCSAEPVLSEGEGLTTKPRRFERLPLLSIAQRRAAVKTHCTTCTSIAPLLHHCCGVDGTGCATALIAPKNHQFLFWWLFRKRGAPAVPCASQVLNLLTQVGIYLSVQPYPFRLPHPL